MTMFVVGNFIGALAQVLDMVLSALLVVILVNALLSWVRPDPNNPIVALLDRVSDFVCDPIRRLFPTSAGGMDFAPFIAMLLIIFLQRFAIGSMRDLALRMG
jgi:YggT family protein